MEDFNDFFELVIYVTFSVIMSVFGVFIILLVCFVPFYWLNSGTYEYVDLDNNKGIATFCEPNDSLQLCHQKDGTIVSVKKYKKIK